MSGSERNDGTSEIISTNDSTIPTLCPLSGTRQYNFRWLLIKLVNRAELTAQHLLYQRPTGQLGSHWQQGSLVSHLLRPHLDQFAPLLDLRHHQGDLSVSVGTNAQRTPGRVPFQFS
jgi:hypothetical protein